MAASNNRQSFDIDRSNMTHCHHFNTSDQSKFIRKYNLDTINSSKHFEERSGP